MGCWIFFQSLVFIFEKKIKKNFRFRMICVIFFVGLCSAYGMRLVVLRSLEARSVQTKIAEIQNQCVIFSKAIPEVDKFGENLSKETETELAFLSSIYNGRILLLDRGFRIQRDTYEIDTGKILVSQNATFAMSGRNQAYYDRKNHSIEVMVPILHSVSNEVRGVMVVSVTTDGLRDLTDNIKQNSDIMLILIGFISLGIATLFGWRALLPLKKVSKELQNISEGDLEKQILEGEYEEIQELLFSLEHLLEKMKVLDESRNEFVSNVSHELKTPLTSMKVLADSLLHMEGAPIELYQEFMQDLSEEIEREDRIITDLLSLVKMDKRAETLEIKSVSLVNFIEGILKRLLPIANQKKVKLMFENTVSVQADIDEIKFSLVLSNLIENGIKYNEEGGFVQVRLEADSKFFYIDIQDSGMGIPEEDLEHIFERFYRVDKSHSREIGGTGLGLAIARKAILMHRGTIKVSSEVGVGSCFQIRVPLMFVGVKE